MIRLVGHIIGMPILSHGEGDHLAILGQPIIHPDTGKIEAFWVKPLTLPFRQGVLLADDILEWKKYIYIKNDRAIAEPDEVIRISEILDRGSLFLDNRVVGESGRGYGKVFDLDFDDRIMYLRYLFVRKSFLFMHGPVRIFSYENVLEVQPSQILVKEEVEKGSEKIALADRRQPAMDA